MNPFNLVDRFVGLITARPVRRRRREVARPTPSFPTALAPVETPKLPQQAGQNKREKAVVNWGYREQI